MRMSLIGEKLIDILIDGRVPLVHVAANEAVKVVEAHSDRPLIFGASLAGLPQRHVMVLAEPRSCVVVGLQDTPDGCAIFADRSVVSGESARHFGHLFEADGTSVTPRDQRRTRR